MQHQKRRRGVLIILCTSHCTCTCLLTCACNTVYEQVKGLMEHTVKAHGRLDYLVNNGGGQFMSSVADIRAKGWHAVIETNLTGTFYCCKHGNYMSLPLTTPTCKND